MPVLLRSDTKYKFLKSRTGFLDFIIISPFPRSGKKLLDGQDPGARTSGHRVAGRPS
jgi:hypothetical protein